MKKGFVIWLTGLPSSGKTTIATGLKEEFGKKRINIEMFDGDEVRKNLSAGLGFSKEDREIHNKRVIYVARLLERNGVAVVISLISPYRKIRDYARKEFNNFVEVWVNCPVKECIKRDVKGLYKKALAGEIDNLTGVQAPYEEPEKAEVIVRTDLESLDESVSKIMKELEDSGLIQ